jgi:hypothetical protein
MKLLRIAALSATLLVTGCATEYAWQRIDGDPLDRHFAWAAKHCRHRASNDWGDRTEEMERCMRRHGYVWTAVAISEPYGGYGYDRYGRHHRRFRDNDRDYEYDYDNNDD